MMHFDRRTGCGASASNAKTPPMLTNDEKLENIRKRLAWRASRRGIKEMDIIMGGYADVHLPMMLAKDLVVFEALLEIPDQQLLSWVTRQEDVPLELRNPMLMEILAFRPQAVKL
jgi:antitoxin CptB